MLKEFVEVVKTKVSMGKPCGEALSLEEFQPSLEECQPSLEECQPSLGANRPIRASASQPTAARWVTLQKASASGIKCQGLAKGSGPIKAIHGANPGRTGSLGQGSTVVIFEQAQRYGRGHRGIKDRQRVSCHKQEPQSMARGARLT